MLQSHFIETLIWGCDRIHLANKVTVWRSSGNRLWLKIGEKKRIIGLKMTYSNAVGLPCIFPSVLFQQSPYLHDLFHIGNCLASWAESCCMGLVTQLSRRVKVPFLQNAIGLNFIHTAVPYLIVSFWFFYSISFPMSKQFIGMKCFWVWIKKISKLCKCIPLWIQVKEL